MMSQSTPLLLLVSFPLSWLAGNGGIVDVSWGTELRSRPIVIETLDTGEFDKMISLVHKSTS